VQAIVTDLLDILQLSSLLLKSNSQYDSIISYLLVLFTYMPVHEPYIIIMVLFTYIPVHQPYIIIIVLFTYIPVMNPI